MYKIVDISVETWNKAGVSVTNTHENDNVNKTLLKINLYLWHCKNNGVVKISDLIDKEIKEKYKVTSMSDLTKQQMKKYKIDRSRLIKGSKHYMCVHEDIAYQMQKQLNLDLI